MSDPRSSGARPVPGVAGRPITMDEYHDLTPEKLELWQGYLIDPPDCPEQRRDLLLLLLVNEGLAEVVRLAPRDAWESALRQAYDDA